MELDQIRAFVLAVEAGSIQGAARRLNRSQPAATRLIQSLEWKLGGVLLDRRTRPTTATEFGRQVLEQARRTLDAADRLAGHSRKAGGSDAVRIKLGVSHAYTRIVASRLMSGVLLSGRQPCLSIQTGWSLPLLRQLRESALDAALISFPPTWSPPADLHNRRICCEELVVIAPKGMALPGVVDLGDLAPYPWVLNSDGCGLRERLQSAFAARGRSLEVRVDVVGSLYQHIDFVAAGFGLGLVPLRSLSVHSARAGVRRVRLRKRLNTYLWLLWREMDGAMTEQWEKMRAILHRSATARAV